MKTSSKMEIDPNDKFFGAKRRASLGHRAVPREERWTMWVERVRHAIARATHEAGTWMWRWRDQQGLKHVLHPVVVAALKACQPASIRVLMFQWPHEAENPSQLAYTPTPGYLDRDRVLATSPGKYLRAAFPLLTDNAIRDIVALHAPSALPEGQERFGIAWTMPEMLQVMELGPPSCMAGTASKFGSFPHHPYEVYDPALGWGLAYQRETKQSDFKDRFRSRAVVMKDAEDKRFVRTYEANDNYDGHSQGSTTLDGWLTQQGYEKAHTWEGYNIKRIESAKGLVCPYIDGGDQHVGYYDSETLLISDSGRCASNQHGLAGEEEEDEDEDEYHCISCGDGYDDSGNGRYLGRHGDGWYCEGCSEDFISVTGARGEEYYVDPDDAVQCCVSQDWFDKNYLSYNDVICLENGNYAKDMYATPCVHDKEYYLTDDHSWWENAYGDNILLDNVTAYLEDHIEEIPQWDDSAEDPRLMRLYIEAVAAEDITDDAMSDKEKEALAKYCEALGVPNPLDVEEEADEEETIETNKENT